MSNLQEEIKGNISLPTRLQSPDVANMYPEEVEQHPMIINVQKAMYEAILTDLQKKIKRLEIRNEDLENLCDTVKTGADVSLEEDTEIQLVELNNSIAFESKKVAELTKKFDDMETVRQEEISKHMEKMNQMEEKFENTRRLLHSEIKIMNAKINIIEEFKSAEEHLRKKLNDQIETTLQKEEEMERTLAELDFKAKIHKENLKREMYRQILDMSKDYQYDLKKTVPPTVQRLMRENIVLENELDILLSDQYRMQEELKNKDKMKEYREKINEVKSNNNRRLITYKIQSILIDKMQRLCPKLRKEFDKSRVITDHSEQRYLTIMDKIKTSECVAEDCHRRKLELLYHQELIKLAMMDSFKDKTALVLEKLVDALSSLKNTVNSELEARKYDIKDAFTDVSFETLTCRLLNAIEDCESQKWLVTMDSHESVFAPEHAYKIGDLGFEPNHVNIIEHLYPMMDKSKSYLEMNTLDILKELEELSLLSEEQQLSESTKKSFCRSSTDITNSSEAFANEFDFRKHEMIDKIDKSEKTSIEGNVSHELSEYEASDSEYEMADYHDSETLQLK